MPSLRLVAIMSLLAVSSAQAAPTVVGYTIIGGSGIDDVASGSKATYIATNDGDEIKLLGGRMTLISTFDKVTLLTCGKQCARYQAPLVVLLKGKAHEAKLLVAGSGIGANHPLSNANGFTVVAEAQVSSVAKDRYGSKIIKMTDGKTVKVSMLLMDPLYGTEVLVLAKSIEIVDKKTGQPKTFTMFKLLIEGKDLVDVAP